jgi:hypothetical protein
LAHIGPACPPLYIELSQASNFLKADHTRPKVLVNSGFVCSVLFTVCDSFLMLTSKIGNKIFTTHGAEKFLSLLFIKMQEYS